MKKLNTFSKYLFEFIVVFAGVFAAFLLDGYRTEQQEKQRKREIYTALYEDLNHFYVSGRWENEDGFLNLFKETDQKIDSTVALKKIQAKFMVYGDYWKIDIVSSFLTSGALQDIDIKVLQDISRFYTVHQNFLKLIEDFNEFYDTHITSNIDQGVDYFYKPNSNELKDRYYYLVYAFEGIQHMGELLVDGAERISKDIKEKHLEE